MPVISTAIVPYLGYLAPPLLGAFIGYFTNKVAIRMLFRPLKAWRIVGIRVPMTPGVIPSKREQLAINIGEMVGQHLLTSQEIGSALEKKKFQDHLYTLIEERIGGIFDKDLGPLPTVIPEKYNNYFNIGIKTISYNIKMIIRRYLESNEFEMQIRTAICNGLDHFLERDIDSIFNIEEREECYEILDRFIVNMLASQSMDQWIEDFIYGRVNTIIKKQECLKDLLPDSLVQLLLQSIEAKTPELLSKFAEILKDPGIQDKIIIGVKNGVENFTESLGPMGGMVKNFVTMETVEKIVKDYFKEKEDDIYKWLQNEDVQTKVAASILDRAQHYLNMPLAEIIATSKGFDIETMCKTLSTQISAILREESTANIITTMLRENIEMFLRGGSIPLKSIIPEIFGSNGITKSKNWLSNEGIALLRSQKAKESIDMMIERLLASLLQKRVGKLSNILPIGVREGMYSSIQKMASAMLAVEVPGLVSTLNIQSIVAEKVNSLDLLRLEGLLLSIMEEQFKYINLFGGLLGFIIGCLNLIFISIA